MYTTAEKEVTALNGICDARKKAGLTQTELAAKIGVSQASVAMWECGSKYPSSDKLPAIAVALGCSIDDLFAAPAGAI